MNDVDKLFAGLLNTEEDDAEPKAEPEAEPEAEPAASASNVKEPAAAAAGVEQLAEQDVDEPEDPMLELREQLNSIQSRLAVLAQSQAKPPEELPKVKELPHHEFVSDDDIADMLTDAKRLNDVLNKVYKKAYEDASNDALQAARVEVPRIVSQEAQRRAEAGRLVKNFWSEHAYLFSGVQGAVAKERRKQAVQLEVNRIYAQNPALSETDILNQAAKNVADLLGIVPPKKGKAQRTQFAQAGGRSAATRTQVKSAPPSKAAEVTDILERVGR